MSAPIGVVVVHYGTDDLTLRCLRALLADQASPPTRVVLVDNGPGEGIAAAVREELPAVQVVVPGRNTGFAGGCNLGIAALGPDVGAVALVNSDVVVSPGWLVPLLAALEADERVGAAVPKTRFDGRFHRLEVDATPTWRPGRGDRRDLAWQPRRFEVAGADVTAATHLVEGFWEPGRGGRWAGPHTVVQVPASDRDASGTVRIDLATPPRQPVALTIAGRALAPAGPGDPVTVEVPLGSTSVPVIANVGNDWRDDGYGLDLGRFEVDAGQHDAPTDVPAWCGAAVLLQGAYLADVGTFDERLFLYYEDLELSRRGAARGWRYRYEPASVVEHRVGSSSGGTSSRVERLRERNRLLVLARHGSGPRLRRELLRFLLVTLALARREIVAPVLRGAAPSGWLVRIRLRALLASRCRACPGSGAAAARTDGALAGPERTRSPAGAGDLASALRSG